jgi:hypothetical protein
MVSAATRSDVQGMVEGAKNTLLDRLAPRNYIQAMSEGLRISILQNLNELHAENQLVIRAGQTQREQLMQRMASMETEMRTMRQLIVQLLEQQARMMSRLPRN